jgi:hypothetical protein
VGLFNRGCKIEHGLYGFLLIYTDTFFKKGVSIALKLDSVVANKFTTPLDLF